MPSFAAQSAARREVVTTLRLAGAVASYAAEQIGNGLGPAEARRAAVEAAVELVAVADALRRAVRLCPACGKPVDTTPRPGRPRVYCCERCRWKHGHERRAADLGLSRRSSVTGPFRAPRRAPHDRAQAPIRRDHQS